MLWVDNGFSINEMLCIVRTMDVLLLEEVVEDKVVKEKVAVTAFVMVEDVDVVAMFMGFILIWDVPRVCVCVYVIDDGQEQDDGMGGDVITSSPSLLRENGLSHFGECACVFTCT